MEIISNSYAGGWTMNMYYLCYAKYLNLLRPLEKFPLSFKRMKIISTMNE